MKFQKLFSFLWMVMMLIGFGASQVMAQDAQPTPDQTPEQTQVKPKHKKKALAETTSTSNSDVESRLATLEQQNQDLEERLQNIESNAFSSPSAGKQAMYQVESVDESGWQGGPGMHESAEEFDAGNEYIDSESRHLTFTDPAGKMAFRIGGYMFADAELNFYPSGVYLNNAYNSQSTTANFNQFLARKAHLDFGGRYEKMFGFAIGIESDKSTSVSIGFFHAYAYAEFDKMFRLQIGKFTNPMSLEGLQPSADLPFMEASMIADLVPNKDIGLQISGEYKHFFDYAIDFANGEQDNESSATGPGKDTDNVKAVSARIFFTPWHKSGDEMLQDLGFGIGGSWDNEVNGDTGVWAKMETSLGGNAFMSYSSSVVPKGDFFHWDPQAYYYYKNLGLQAEFVQSIQTVGEGTLPSVQLTNTAWMVEANWVFGGEATFEGAKIDHEFDLSKGDLGAFELVARLHQVYVDGNSFIGSSAGATWAPGATTGLATGAQVATGMGVGVNWWFNPHCKTMFDFERTEFSGGTMVVVPEQVFYSRLTFIL